MIEPRKDFIFSRYTELTDELGDNPTRRACLDALMAARHEYFAQVEQLRLEGLGSTQAASSGGIAEIDGTIPDISTDISM